MQFYDFKTMVNYKVISRRVFGNQPISQKVTYLSCLWIHHLLKKYDKSKLWFYSKKRYWNRPWYSLKCFRGGRDRQWYLPKPQLHIWCQRNRKGAWVLMCTLSCPMPLSFDQVPLDSEPFCGTIPSFFSKCFADEGDIDHWTDTSYSLQYVTVKWILEGS